MKIYYVMELKNSRYGEVYRVKSYSCDDALTSCREWINKHGKSGRTYKITTSVIGSMLVL